jgi:predicted acylesterase/phospholipase RssA
MKFILALLLASSVDAKKSKSCKALAMSGGGAKGSFEAGALWGLYKTDTDKTKYEYDVVTGVSAGAINTLALSLFAPGDEANMLDFLTNQW